MADRTPPVSQHTAASRRQSEGSRREFVARAAALGAAAALANHLHGGVGAAQDASPNTTLHQRPATGTEHQIRGAGGELKLIQWQAPSHLSALQAIGEKDRLAASLVSEPLMVRGSHGQLIPNLITTVPTVENGLLPEDASSVTFNLLEGITWSDGEPFTAADVIFTLDWILDRPVTGAPAATNGAVTKTLHETIDTYTATGDRQVTVTFTQPNPGWAEGFTGAGVNVIYPRHILDGGGQGAIEAFRSNPIGTGPYTVESFSPNDEVVYTANERYREPNMPYFGHVVLKGGGDAASAARSVIQTGEYDAGWNIAIEPELAVNLQRDDSPGVLLVTPGTSIERINVNFSDPWTEVDGQISEMHTPNPVLSDLAVRQAMNLAIDRNLIASACYFGGHLEPATANILSGIPAMESATTTLVHNPAGAATLLDEAGWVLDGDVRQKDGLELALTFQTSTNQVRQKVQQMVKHNLEAVGFRVHLEQIDAAAFFDNAEGNDRSASRFAADLNMLQSPVGWPPPISYMGHWYAGGNGANIAQASNEWTGQNIQRYSNPEYDELYRAARLEGDVDARNDLLIAMNDLLLEDAVVLPLVRLRKRTAVARSLNQENLAPNPYEGDYWNIANWNRLE